ncbi:MAG: winged helix-turn-helix transcriptional regulator [Anaerolineaceae bacterium]|nr:winged helix-turn-helix transcriptional regulator [Anaerolineaceae bacterium]
MLETLIGSENRERVLIFLKARGEGYAREIARFFDTDLFPIQDQLERLEVGGVLVSRPVGRTILYQFNPRYFLLEELEALLEKAVYYYPKEMREDLLMNRRRPRRRGKPE